MSEDIERQFSIYFGGKPAEFVATSPGRVNLIGEHIDYNGYGVLPMAIEQRITAAFRKNDTKMVNLRNVNDKYEPYTFSIDALEIDRKNPKWHQYFMCGFRGIAEHLGSVSRGMDVLVSGSVPASAGLSSSSALVCCAAIATLKAQTGRDFDFIPRDKLAELCAKSERHIGTEGGGMDQAISLLAEEGKAKRIDFNPLRCVDVRLPAGAAFVVAHGCTEANKAASSEFNQRVVECRLAAKVIAKQRNLDWNAVKKLGDLQSALIDSDGVEPSLDEMISIAERELHDGAYKKKEICQLLGVTEEQLNETTLSANTLEVQSFTLRARAVHVYAEASRVYRFAAVCAAADGDLTLTELGQLMDDSHRSCSQLYECSCPELDELVTDCKSAGALGARLTGAGWGGCAVALVHAGGLPSFLEALRNSFYNRTDARRLRFDTAVFHTRPAGGATIRKVL